MIHWRASTCKGRSTRIGLCEAGRFSDEHPKPDIDRLCGPAVKMQEREAFSNCPFGFAIVADKNPIYVDSYLGIIYKNRK